MYEPVKYGVFADEVTSSAFAAVVGRVASAVKGELFDEDAGASSFFELIESIVAVPEIDAGVSSTVGYFIV